MKEVKCIDCGIVFERTGRNTKRCIPCRKTHARLYAKAYHKRNYVKTGYHGFGEKNNNWKGGLGKLLTGDNKRIRAERKICAHCGRHVEHVGRYHWCIHHIDGNRQNNVDSNLMLLCKRCHQVEHDCRKNLESATTIPKGSTA